MPRRCARRSSRRSAPEALLRLVSQAELHLYLVVIDLAVDDVAADLGHLEPFEIAKRFRRSVDAVADRLVEAAARAADDLGDAVDMIVHRSLRPIRSEPWIERR